MYSCLGIVPSRSQIFFLFYRQAKAEAKIDATRQRAFVASCHNSFARLTSQSNICVLKFTMDEIELPPLPITQCSYMPITRKRSRSDYDPASSSDPALFSSDDHVPSADNYSSKRQKDQWKGTWWGERVRRRSAKGKREFKRNFDSGIFMGSEGTDTSLDGEFLEEQNTNDVLRERCFDRRAGSGPFLLYHEVALQKLPKASLVSPAHHQARAVIQRCLETGNEDVDLS